MDVLICQACGFILRGKGKFCTGCGTYISKFSPTSLPVMTEGSAPLAVAISPDPLLLERLLVRQQYGHLNGGNGEGSHQAAAEAPAVQPTVSPVAAPSPAAVPPSPPAPDIDFQPQAQPEPAPPVPTSRLGSVLGAASPFARVQPSSVSSLVSFTDEIPRLEPEAMGYQPAAAPPAEPQAPAAFAEPPVSAAFAQFGTATPEPAFAPPEPPASYGLTAQPSAQEPVAAPEPPPPDEPPGAAAAAPILSPGLGLGSSVSRFSFLGPSLGTGATGPSLFTAGLSGEGLGEPLPAPGAAGVPEPAAQYGALPQQGVPPVDEIMAGGQTWPTTPADAEGSPGLVGPAAAHEPALNVSAEPPAQLAWTPPPEPAQQATWVATPEASSTAGAGFARPVYEEPSPPADATSSPASTVPSAQPEPSSPPVEADPDTGSVTSPLTSPVGSFLGRPSSLASSWIPPSFTRSSSLDSSLPGGAPDTQEAPPPAPGPAEPAPSLSATDALFGTDIGSDSLYARSSPAQEAAFVDGNAVTAPIANPQPTQAAPPAAPSLFAGIESPPAAPPAAPSLFAGMESPPAALPAAPSLFAGIESSPAAPPAAPSLFAGMESPPAAPPAAPSLFAGDAAPPAPPAEPAVAPAEPAPSLSGSIGAAPPAPDQPAAGAGSSTAPAGQAAPAPAASPATGGTPQAVPPPAPSGFDFFTPGAPAAPSTQEVQPAPAPPAVPPRGDFLPAAPQLPPQPAAPAAAADGGIFAPAAPAAAQAPAPDMPQPPPMPAPPGAPPAPAAGALDFFAGGSPAVPPAGMPATPGPPSTPPADSLPGAGPANAASPPAAAGGMDFFAVAPPVIPPAEGESSFSPGSLPPAPAPGSWTPPSGGPFGSPAEGAPSADTGSAGGRVTEETRLPEESATRRTTAEVDAKADREKEKEAGESGRKLRGMAAREEEEPSKPAAAPGLQMIYQYAPFLEGEVELAGRKLPKLHAAIGAVVALFIGLQVLGFVGNLATGLLKGGLGGQQAANLPPLSGKWELAFKFGAQDKHGYMFLQFQGNQFSGEGQDDAYFVVQGVIDPSKNPIQVQLNKQYVVDQQKAGKPILYAGKLQFPKEGPYMSGVYIAQVKKGVFLKSKIVEVRNNWEAAWLEPLPSQGQPAPGPGAAEAQPSDPKKLQQTFTMIGIGLLAVGAALAAASFKLFGPSGLVNIWAKKEYIPSQFKSQHAKMVREFGKPLRPGGLPLGQRMEWNITQFYMPKELAMPPDVRETNPHMLIIGAGAKGKSRLIASMICHDIQSNDRAVVVVDSDGGLIELITRWIAAHPKGKEFAERVIIIDPTHKGGCPAYNPLEEPEDGDLQAAASAVVFGFKAIYTEPPGSQSQWNQQTANILRNSALLLMVNGKTLTDLPTLLSDNDFRDILLEKVEKRKQEKVEFITLLETWGQYKRLARTDQWINWVEPILNRVSPMLSDPRIRPILTKPKGDINLKNIITEGKVLLVKVPQGQLDQNANLLGSLLVTGLKRAALSIATGSSRKHPCSLYLDEFDNFIEKETVDSLTSETKKFQIGLIGAVKTLQHLPEDFRSQLVINVGTMCIFALAKKDGDMLGPQMFRVDGRKVKHQTITNIFNRVNSSPQFELISDEEKLNIDRVVGQEERTFFCYRVGTVAGVFHMKSPEFKDIPDKEVNWTLMDDMYGKQAPDG